MEPYSLKLARHEVIGTDIFISGLPAVQLPSNCHLPAVNKRVPLIDLKRWMMPQVSVPEWTLHRKSRFTPNTGDVGSELDLRK
jgi:hypothetical protein